MTQEQLNEILELHERWADNIACGRSGSDYGGKRANFKNEIIGGLDFSDKIESGELCDREEVRKQTAKEILKELLFSVENCKKEDILWYIESISKRYGVELFGKTEQVGNPDKLEDEV